MPDVALFTHEQGSRPSSKPKRKRVEKAKWFTDELKPDDDILPGLKTFDGYDPKDPPECFYCCEQNYKRKDAVMCAKCLNVHHKPCIKRLFEVNKNTPEKDRPDDCCPLCRGKVFIGLDD